MKILIPRNNKDYYDCLIAGYGIDDEVVYESKQVNHAGKYRFRLI